MSYGCCCSSPSPPTAQCSASSFPSLFTMFAKFILISIVSVVAASAQAIECARNYTVHLGDVCNTISASQNSSTYIGLPHLSTGSHDTHITTAISLHSSTPTSTKAAPTWHWASHSASERSDTTVKIPMLSPQAMDAGLFPRLSASVSTSFWPITRM